MSCKERVNKMPKLVSNLTNLNEEQQQQQRYKEHLSSVQRAGKDEEVNAQNLKDFTQRKQFENLENGKLEDFKNSCNFFKSSILRYFALLIINQRKSSNKYEGNNRCFNNNKINNNNTENTKFCHNNQSKNKTTTTTASKCITKDTKSNNNKEIEIKGIPFKEDISHNNSAAFNPMKKEKINSNLFYGLHLIFQQGYYNGNKSQNKHKAFNPSGANNFLFMKPPFVLLVLMWMVLLANCRSVSAEHHNCQHFHPKAHEVIHGVRIRTADDDLLATPSLSSSSSLSSSAAASSSELMVHGARKRRSILNQPLRILLVYDESVYRLDEEKFNLINNTILPEAVQFWEQALMVRQTKDVIRLNRKCDSTQVFVKNGYTHCIDKCKSKTMCGEVEVPEEHLDVCRVCNSTGQNCHADESTEAGEGIENADFVFYVSARQTERCYKGLTVAYAAHCQQEATLDRPIAGHANLCPDSISTKPQELQTLLSTVKHEILHALGFSVSLYAFFRDDDGKPRTPRKPDTGKPYLNEKLQVHQWSEETIRKVVRKRWSVRGGHITKTIDMMVTPRVVDEVRKHFACPKLEGAELENQGGEGTALTHWEKRILENEAMTGTHTQSPVFSRITLALMEDTGWYRANYSMATPLTWGKGLGCDFVMNSCKFWIQSNHAKGRSIHPFCSKVKQDPLQTECTDDRNSVALCNLVRHEHELDKEYQNFDSIAHVKDGEEGFYGGSVSLADHCPYIQEFTWRSKNVTVRGSHCRFVENNPKPEKNFALESYGHGSKCFDHSDSMWEEHSCHQTREWQHWGSGCYKYNCSDGRLHILVANYSYTCYFPGQQLSIRIKAHDWLHKGAIICPPCHELCGEYFRERDQQCRFSEEAPPLNFFPRDNLECGSSSCRLNFSLLLGVAIFLIVHISKNTFPKFYYLVQF